VHWTIGPDTTSMNVLHYSYSGSGPAASDCTALATTLFNAIPTALLGMLPASTIATGVTVTDLASVTGAQGAVTGSKPGTSGGQAVPANAAFLVQLHTNARYRGGHPRMYLPPFYQAEMADQGHWLATGVSTATAAVNTWLNTLQGSVSGATTVGVQVAVSYYHAHALRPTPVVMSISSRTGVARIASQRRRIPKT
jgi:hypothetical protein